VVTAGSLVWVFERRANPEHFSGGPLKGIADGLCWAAVTMATAHITSTLTVTGLSGRVREPADLPHVRLAWLSTSRRSRGRWQPRTVRIIIAIRGNDAVKNSRAAAQPMQNVNRTFGKTSTTKKL
jgi:hypothetical protein